MMFPHLLTGLSREIVIQIPSRSRSRVCFPCQVFLTHRPCACHTRPHAISPWYHPLPKSAVAKHVLACKMSKRDLLLSLFWEFVFFFYGWGDNHKKGRVGSTFHQESWEGEYDRHKKTAAKEATNFSTQNIKNHEISLQNNIGYSSWRIQ